MQVINSRKWKISRAFDFAKMETEKTDAITEKDMNERTKEKGKTLESSKERRKELRCEERSVTKPLRTANKEAFG